MILFFVVVGSIIVDPRPGIQLEKYLERRKKSHGFCNSVGTMAGLFMPSTVPSGVEGCIRLVSRSGPNRPRNWTNGFEEPNASSISVSQLATDPCSDIWPGSGTGNWSVPSPISSVWSTGNCCRGGCWVTSCDCRP